jgi:hypothetical protein
MLVSLGAFPPPAQSFGPERPNHVWSRDFVSTYTHDGRTVGILKRIDEFTGKRLAIHARRRRNSRNVIEVVAGRPGEKAAP